MAVSLRCYYAKAKLGTTYDENLAWMKVELVCNPVLQFEICRLVKGICGAIRDVFLHHECYAHTDYVTPKYLNTPLDFTHIYHFTGCRQLVV